MATTTENLELVTPEAEDRFSVEHFNENMEALDTFAGNTANTFSELDSGISTLGESIDADFDALNEKVTAVNNKIGTSSDSGTGTVFGKLNNTSSSAIKSIHHFTGNFTHSSTNNTFTFAAVNTSKCIVILERLYDSKENNSKITYTLASTTLTATMDFGATSGSATIGFWIIEFN